MNSKAFSVLSIFPLSISLVLVGCSNNTLVKSANLSASSAAYTETVNELLDQTVDLVIDVDSKELLKTRKGKNRGTRLRERNEALRQLVAEINQFRHQTTLVNNYFVNLQTLADSTVKDDIGVSLGEVSGRIQYLNDRSTDGSDELNNSRLFTVEDKEYVGRLGSMIVGAHYSAKIEAALKRDAPIIGKQMLLQEKQLNQILDVLKDRMHAKSITHLTENVVSPFVNPDIDELDEATWIENRRRWFELQQAASIFNDVKEAQKALRLAWEDILRGKADIGTTALILADVHDFLGTLQDLDQSRSKENLSDINLMGE